jgi:FAD/FMN-containing dehydrogenase
MCDRDEVPGRCARHLNYARIARSWLAQPVVAPTALSLDELRLRHRGPVIAAEDLGYDAARATFNGMIDRRPAVVARPLDVADVVAAVEFAGQAGLPVSVRGGGHGVAGLCVGDGSVVVDLRLMREVSVDPEMSTVLCGGGALWEDLDPPCQRHRLATPGGTFGDTGVAGLTLGGGVGHLLGLYGLTLDNLLAATVVTADGTVVQTSEGENPELFWALRGGGGNFGAVVDFTFRLQPVDRLLGGLIVYGLDDVESVVAAWRELMISAPDELMCIVGVSRSILAGERAYVSVAYFGDPDVGREVIQPLVQAARPTIDSVRPMYYAELQEIFGRMPFGLRNYWSGRFLRELPDEAIEVTANHLRPPDVFGTILLEPMHGAGTRVPADTTAFAGREAKYNATFIGFWENPDDDERRVATARAYSAALAPWMLGGGYLNYASEPAGTTLETEFGAERFAQLRKVKREFDPSNTFRFNHNIPPV